MLCDPFLISIKPGEAPEGGSCSEESRGADDSSSVLGGHSLKMGLLGAVLLVLCLTGVVGNIYTVLVAFGKVAGCSAGSLGIYLINLTLADLLYLFTIPFVVCTYFAHDWYFGDVDCRLLLSLDHDASIFLLTAMSLERYWAVARLLWARRAGNAYRRLVSAILWLVSLLWLLSLLLMAPIMAMTQLWEGGSHPKHICIPTWAPAAFRLYLTVLFTTSILTPGMVLGIIYSWLSQMYQFSACGLGLAVAGQAAAQWLLSRISAIMVAYWAFFLPFWVWQ